MSCMWCARFHRPYDPDVNPREDGNAAYLDRPGKCTLTPEPVDVRGSHVCSSFMWKETKGYNFHYKFNGPTTPLASLWLSARDDEKEMKGLRKEVRRLKEANKGLRAKLKAVKEPAL